MGATNLKQKFLFAAATYLYCILRVSGFLQISFNFTTRQFESSLVATIYSWSILVWFTFYYPQCVEDFQSGFDDKINEAQSPVDRKIYSAFTTILIIVNLVQIYNRNRLKNLLNHMIDVARRIETNYSDSKVNIHPWILLNILQSCIVHLTYFVVFSNLPEYLVEDTLENRFLGFVVIIPGGFFLLLANGVTNVVTVLIHLFLKINNSIRGSQEDLQILEGIHSELCHILKTITHLTSHLLLSVFFYIFCVIILEAYLVYVYVAEMTFLNNSFSVASLTEGVVIFSVFMALLLIHVIICSKCTVEMRRTPQLIVEALRQKRDYNSQVESFLLRCTVQCEPDFMVYNMLAVNFSLVYEMLGTIASYVIVMVQIHISYVAAEK